MKAETYRDRSGNLRYVTSKRLVYTPELFPRNDKSWTYQEIKELVNSRPFMKWEDIGLMLGRTPATCMDKYCKLKKKGELEKYKNRKDEK